MVDIHGLGFNSYTWAINSSDHIVGESRVNNPQLEVRGFLWTPESGMMDLNALLVPEDNGWFIQAAYGINDSGYIVAEAQNAAGIFRPILLVPVAVPEPTTLALVGGVASLRLWRWRRRRRQCEVASVATVGRY
jgi:probable HAF family extracellular repeat protein